VHLALFKTPIIYISRFQYSKEENMYGTKEWEFRLLSKLYKLQNQGM